MSENYESGFEKMVSNMGYSVELTAHEANCIVTEAERLQRENIRLSNEIVALMDKYMQLDLMDEDAQ